MNGSIRLPGLTLAGLLLLASCYEQPPLPCMARPWVAADCLPSATPNDRNCDGDKPSWQEFLTDSLVVWQYVVLARDTTACVRYFWKCTFAPGRDWIRAESIPIQVSADPRTGRIQAVADRHGFRPGDTVTITGKIDSQGRVRVAWWDRSAD